MSNYKCAICGKGVRNNFYTCLACFKTYGDVVGWVRELITDERKRRYDTFESPTPTIPLSSLSQSQLARATKIA